MPSSLAEALYRKLRPLQHILKATLQNVRHPRRHLNAYFKKAPDVDFDASFYKSIYRDIPDGEDPWNHYCRLGKVQGRLTKSLSAAEFDEIYYLESNPDVRESNIHPQDHYHRFGIREGRNPLRPHSPEEHESPLTAPLLTSQSSSNEYSSEFKVDAILSSRAAALMKELNCMGTYLELNPGVQNVEPVQHFSEVGIYEGKSFCNENDATENHKRFNLSREQIIFHFFDPLKYYIICYSVHSSPSVRTFIHLLRVYLIRLGAQVQLAERLDAIELNTSYECLIVSPHAILEDRENWKSLPQKMISKVINLECCYTDAFSKGLNSILAQEQEIIDIYEHNVYLFKKAGCKSSLLDLDAVYSQADRLAQTETPTPFAVATRKGLQALSREGNAEKPIDVLFMGAHSERASRLLVALSSTLAELNCCVVYKHEYRYRDSVLSLADTRLLARASKYVLEIAPDTYPEVNPLHLQELCNRTHVILLCESNILTSCLKSSVKRYRNVRELISLLREI